MTIQVQCQNCFAWVTHNLLLVELLNIFGIEISKKCGLCRREIKFVVMK